MADHPFQIRLKIDRTDAKTDTEAAKAELKDVEQAAKRSAEAQEQGTRKAAKARVEGAREAGRAEKQSLDESAKASDGFAFSLRKVAIEQIALSKIVDVGRAITSVMEAASQRMSDLAKESNRVRDDLREIAQLKGLTTVTDEFMRQNTGFLRATGMTGQEGVAFRTAFGGASALSAGVTIDKGEELDRFEKLSGQFAVMKKTDPKILAELAGASLRFKDYRGKGGSERAVGDVAGVFSILEQGAGSTALLAEQQKKLAAGFVTQGEAAGAFANPLESAAAITVAAESSPDASSIITQQALRAIRGLNDKQGGMLKGAGITYQDTFRSGMPKLFAAMDKAVAAGKTPEQFLSEAGINAEEARAVSVFYNKRGMLDSQMAAADVAAKADPAATVGAINQSFANDKGIRGRLNASALEAAKVERGMQTEPGELVKGEVEARMFAAGEIDTGATDTMDWLAGIFSNPLSGDRQGAGRKARLNAATRAKLAGEGVQVPSGIPEWATYLGPAALLAEGWNMTSGQADRDLSAGASKLERNIERQTQIMEAEATQRRVLPTVVPGGGGNGPSRE